MNLNDLLGEDGVERPGPGLAPTAFRLWRAGVNQADIGPVNLTPRALASLLAMQEQKGVRYSFDLNHGSINANAPPANQVAIGDHRIEGRGGALWAVECQWSEFARAQIEAKPVPGLRYYSPAYDVDKETREPTRYVNCALTPNPATWHATALAAERGIPMNEKQEPPGDSPSGAPGLDMSAIVAGLHKLAAETTDPQMRAVCEKMIAAAMPSKLEGSKDAGEGKDEPPPSSKDAGALAAAKATAAAPTSLAGADLPPAVAGILGELANGIKHLGQRLDAREQRDAQEQATAIATERASLAGAKGLPPNIITAIKDPTTPIATARLLAGGKAPAQLASISTATVAATRGNPETAVAQLPAEQAAVMHAQMGIVATTAPRAFVDETGRYHRPTETPRQARERLAAETKKGAVV